MAAYSDHQAGLRQLPIFAPAMADDVSSRSRAASFDELHSSFLRASIRNDAEKANKDA
jgi:hypothetical protein